METDVDKISLLRKNNHRPGGDHFDRHLEKLEKLALKRKNEETVRCLWEIIEADQESAGRGKS
jgi:hypothetical protein